jgi:3-hydroxybutyryl-CoA dehydrogenase
MGSQIACEFATAGHDVTCAVRSAARAERNVEMALDVVFRYGLNNKCSRPQLRHRIRVVARLDDVALAPQLVLESLPEEFDVKVEVLADAAGRWSDAVLASNTSSLSITQIGAAIAAPRRTIGLHYWNPPLLMPLVEVVVTAAIEAGVRARVVEWLTTIGKQPVIVERDVPGFIWNRLQFALLREALWLVEEGVAEPAIVDQVVRDGLARRWRLTGPFETAEFGGLATFARAAENLFPELSVALAAPALREWASRDERELTELAGRRDAGLAKELDARRRDSMARPAPHVQKRGSTS